MGRILEIIIAVYIHSVLYLGRNLKQGCLTSLFVMIMVTWLIVVRSLDCTVSAGDPLAVWRIVTLFFILALGLSPDVTQSDAS